MPMESWCLFFCQRTVNLSLAGATDHIVVDLSDEESTHRAVQQIKDRIGPNGELHALVALSGLCVALTRLATGE